MRLATTLLLAAALAATANAGEAGWVAPTLVDPPAEHYFGGPVALCDLDGDGRLDVVTAASHGPQGGALVVLLQRDGALAPALTLPTPAVIQDLLAADLDGDGRLDLVAATLDEVRVLRQVEPPEAGRVGFADPVAHAPTEGIRAVAAGDLDGDGLPDLVVQGEEVVVLRQTPWKRGAFAASPPAGVAYGTEVLVGDLDGDGAADVLVSGGVILNACTVLRGDPSRPTLLEEPVATNLGSPAPIPGADPMGFPMDAVLADLEGDPAPEVAVALREHGEVWLLRAARDGSGRLDLRRRVPAGCPHPTSLAVGDVDGDGRLDLLTLGLAQETLGLVRRRADGAFAAPEAHVALNAPVELAAGDLDGDGLADVVVSGMATYRSRGALAWVRGAKDGLRAPRRTLLRDAPPRLDDPTRPVLLADLDGDRRPDLLSIAGPDGIDVRRRGPGVDFGPPTRVVPGAGVGEPALGDVDGDGRLDLVVPCVGSGEAVVLLQGPEAGAFRVGPRLRAGPEPGRVALGDLDGDGQLDVVVTNGTSAVTALLQDANGAFREGVTHALGGEPGPGGAWPLVADLDGDGRLDVAVGIGGERAARRRLLLLRQAAQGGGRLDPPAELARDDGGPLERRDVDGDGDLDLLVLGRARAWLACEGPGRFARPRQPGDDAEDLALFARDDVDGDGRADAVRLEVDERLVTVALRGADGKLGPPRTLIAGEGPCAAWVVDLDGDGARELVVGTQGLHPAVTVHRLER